MAGPVRGCALVAELEEVSCPRVAPVAAPAVEVAEGAVAEVELSDTVGEGECRRCRSHWLAWGRVGVSLPARQMRPKLRSRGSQSPRGFAGAWSNRTAGEIGSELLGDG
jgi:hypothetical protein